MTDEKQPFSGRLSGPIDETDENNACGDAAGTDKVSQTDGPDGEKAARRRRPQKKPAETSVKAYALILLLSLGFLLAGFFLFRPAPDPEASEEFYKAEIMSVSEAIPDEGSYNGLPGSEVNLTIPFTAQILSKGPHHKETIKGQQYIDYAYALPPEPVSKGDRVILFYASQGLSPEKIWQFSEYNRVDNLLLFCGFFFLLILLLGRRKGVSTLLALLFTIGAIFLVYLPSLIRGVNIYASTLVICGFIVVMSLLILNGTGKKSLCAILGNLGGLIVAGAIALVMNGMLHITGNVQEEYLLLLSLDHPLDLRALVWASVLIGSIGAVMDVAMTIASALYEVAETAEKPTFGLLFRSGMNIGKDAIGTMTNTLILAYIGGSMALVILLMAYHYRFLFLFNIEMIVVEVLQAVAGSMGILFAVPATALFSAYFYSRGRKNPRRNGAEKA